MALMDREATGQHPEADPFEQHWAVLVVDQVARLRALADATERWLTRRSSQQPLIDRDLQAISELATAYDIAAIEYIDVDEYVEATPKSLRLRKRILDATARKRATAA